METRELTWTERTLTFSIIGAAIKVHRASGPGHCGFSFFFVFFVSFVVASLEESNPLPESSVNSYDTHRTC